ncbi:hypothetical protein [Dethiosulfatarculus sandiegensis]|uniref:DsrE family protein n=1 Tax=Dethiosulfatarculus sandiegensis TaxID=1429043 RepID=A0A0D2J7Y4_9BACT|nr:hypothetical protein [Dethiosulfatarculus sandiegensis]KIX11831.1 hypothetical protein X474_22405 [Dethiosulfatarculus sandiegensis]
MEVDRACVLVRRPRDAWEASRSALGLLLEGIETRLFLLDAKVSLPQGKRESDFQDTLEMILDMGGEVFSNQDEDRERWPDMRRADLSETAQALRECDLVIPF